MPDEQANPQEPHEEEEELDLESQLDAVLSHLKALEPDLLPDPTKPSEPVIAQPAIEESVQTPQPGESSSTPTQTQAVSADPQESDSPQGLGDRLDNLIAQQIDQEIDQESMDDRKAQPEEAATQSPQEQSTAAKLDDLLNQQIDQQIDDAQGDESIPDEPATIPAVGEEAVVAEVSSSPTDEDKKDTSDASTGQQIDDILAQLSGQLTDGDSEEASEVEGADAVGAVVDEDDSLSVDQIDALLAEEAEQTVSDEFETPTEIQASEGSQVSPDAPTDATVGSDVDSDVPADTQGSAQEEPQQPAGGFTAGAGDVAAEIDDQPENKPRVPSIANIASEFKKQDMAERIVICKRALWRTCFVMNKPLEKVPGPVRDAIGYFALAHVMFGSVLILGKLVGIV